MKSKLKATRIKNGIDITDEQIHAVVRKIISNNEETLASCDVAGYIKQLKEENEVLKTLLPKYWSPDQVYAYLTLHGLTEIRNAKSDGQATGVKAIESFKSNRCTCNLAMMCRW